MRLAGGPGAGAAVIPKARGAFGWQHVERQNGLVTAILRRVAPRVRLLDANPNPNPNLTLTLTLSDPNPNPNPNPNRCGCSTPSR